MNINLANGKTFTIDAPQADHENIYVRAATLNGKPLTHPTITHQDIISGATLYMEMTNHPITEQ